MIVDDKYFQGHFSGEFSRSVCGPSGVAPSGPWSHFLDVMSLRVLPLLRHGDRLQLEYTSSLVAAGRHSGGAAFIYRS